MEINVLLFGCGGKKTYAMVQDPSIKELAEQIAKDPAFNNIAEQLQHCLQSSGDGVPQLDTQQYFSAMQQAMGNPQFMSMAEKLGGAILQVTNWNRIVY